MVRLIVVNEISKPGINTSPSVPPAMKPDRQPIYHENITGERKTETSRSETPQLPWPDTERAEEIPIYNFSSG